MAPSVALNNGSRLKVVEICEGAAKVECQGICEIKRAGKLRLLNIHLGPASPENASRDLHIIGRQRIVHADRGNWYFSAVVHAG